MASAGGIRMGKVFVEIGADSSKFFSAVQGLNRSIGKIGASMKKVGAQMMGVGAAIGAPVALAVRQFSQFDDAIRATAAVTGSFGPQGAAAFQMLNDKARDLGATTSFTAVEVANLMTELGRAGFKPDEINNMTAAVLDMARATGTDATRSAGIMAATLRQFELGAEDAARAADILTYTANNTFNTVDSLGESLKYAGPVAKSLGMSLEDTAAILGVLGNVGIQGSEAGTALRRLSVISAGAGEKLNDLFGISNTDAAGNLKPLVTILDEINTVTANMPVAERTAKMAKAFGLLGITSANVLSRSADGVRKLRDGLDTAGGTAARTAKEMDAGMGGAMRIMLSAVEGTALAIGDALAPSLQTAINFLERASTAATGFIKANEGLVLSIATGVAQFAAAGAAMYVLGSAVTIASGVFGTLLSVGASLVGTFAGVMASVIGVVASLASAIVATFSYSAASITAAFASAAAWTAANLAMAGMVVSLGVVVVSLWDSLGLFGLVNDAVDGVANAGRSAMAVLADMGRIGQEAFASIYESINAGNLEGAIAVAMAGMKAIWSTGANSFMDAVDAWGVDLVNAFDFYLSQIPFLRFLGKDKYEFSLFGDSTKSTNADMRADQRGAALFDRKGTRKTDLSEATAGFEAAVNKQRTNNILMTQGNDVIRSVGEAKTVDSLRELADEFFALKSAGAITAEQEKKYGEAVDAAAEKITPTAQLSEELKVRSKIEEPPPVEDPMEIRRAAEAAANRQSEVAGTFSSFSAAGMGFGSTIDQQQLVELKGIRKAIEQDIGDEGAIQN